MKLKQTLFALLLSISIIGFLGAPIALAAEGDVCGSTTLKDGESCCGGVPTSILSCDSPGGEGSVEDSGLWGILILIINIMSAGVGIAAVGGVVYGSVLYTTARGNLDQVKKARVIIANTVVGIVAYVLMFAFLNYMIPGGLFS